MSIPRGAACGAAAILLAAPCMARTAVPDDFNSCVLAEHWLTEDPRGDSTFEIVGEGSGDAVLAISVPGGQHHDAWTEGNFTARVTQPFPNQDLDVHVVFDSPLAATYQSQGLLVQQDHDDFLRIEFYSVNGTVRLFAASFNSGEPMVKLNTAVPVGPRMGLRV